MTTHHPSIEHVAPGVVRILAPNPGPMTLDGTNTYVVRADGGNVVIDPGPLDDDHLDLIARQGDVTHVLLTHRHPDHAEGAQRFADVMGAPLLDREDFVDDGAPVGPAELGLTVIHTPGHTSDSVCFVSEDAVFTGDTVLGRGTTVVAWPDGDLAAYLASLDRIRALGDLTVLPGHGPVLNSAREAAQGYREHRQVRLDQVRAALMAGDTTAEEVVRRVYAEVDPSLWPAAELSVRAQLDYLEYSPDGSEDE